MVALSLCAQEPSAAVQSEMHKVDALVANPDVKLVVVAAMAESLQVHRNHLLLRRKETGDSFATIYVAGLRSRGMDDAGVLRSLRSLLQTVHREIAANQSSAVEQGVRPVLLVGSAGDHNSAGDVFSVVPELGFDSSHLAAVVGVPYYRVSNTSLSAGGVGDVYFSGFLRGRTAGVDFATTLTLGAPTGDRNKGLGAGKVTADATETISRRIGISKPWLSGGFANSVFSNVGYLRPYVTDGKAAHFGGGVDFALPRKLAAGVSGFGLQPVGDQTVYSQVAPSGTSGIAGSQTPPQSGGMMPGGGMGPGMGTGGGMTMPPSSSVPFYMAAQHSAVSASALQDYGASLWLSIPLHSGLTLNTVVARSVPFHLTTVHLGVGIDVARLLFPGKHF